MNSFFLRPRGPQERTRASSRIDRSSGAGHKQSPADPINICGLSLLFARPAREHRPARFPVLAHSHPAARRLPPCLAMRPVRNIPFDYTRCCLLRLSDVFAAFARSLSRAVDDHDPEGVDGPDPRSGAGITVLLAFFFFKSSRARVLLLSPGRPRLGSQKSDRRATTRPRS
jgi:hypothetical protein